MKKIVNFTLILGGILCMFAGCNKLAEEKDVIDARYVQATDEAVTVSLGKMVVSDFVNVTIPVTINDTIAVRDFGVIFADNADFNEKTIVAAANIGEDGKKLFTSEVVFEGLEELKTYYAKAYAYTAGGYIYSEAATVQTEDAPEPDTWTNLGKALYRDGFIAGYYSSVQPLEYEVDILENDQNPGYFRLVNPYGAAYGYNEPGDYDEDQDYYLDIHAEDPDAVWIPVHKSNMHWSDGYFYMGSLAGYYISQGSTLDEQKEAGNTGTFKDGIITFPEKKLLCGEENYNNGALYLANSLTSFRVVMPGISLADYTIGIEYEGIFTSKEGVNNALVNVDITGADVTDVAIVMVEGKDPNAGIALISPEEGEQDASVVTVSAAGEVKLPFAEDATDGFYTIVAAPLDKDGSYDLEYAVYETFTYGNLDPIYLEYTSEDFTAPVSKEELTGTTWIAYAAGYGETPSDRKPCAYVTFTDEEDVDADVDLVSCSGLANTTAFADTFNMEWYNGVLYMLGSAQTGTWNGYDVYAMSYSSAAFGSSDYTMCGAYVGDGIIAMTNNSQSDNFYGIGFWAVADGSVAGYIVPREYLLLVDPAILEDASGAPAKRNISSMNHKNLVEVNSFCTKRNITFNQRDWSKDVVASGKVWSHSTIDKANITHIEK